MARTETERLARTPSGKALFVGTIVAVLVALLLALITGIAGIPWLAFAIPALWFLFIIALLYLSGRAISGRRRPGEAATSLLLALLLTPIVTLAPAASFVPTLVERVNALRGDASASPGGGGLDSVLPPTDPEPTEEESFPTPDESATAEDEPMEDLPIEGNFEDDVTIEPTTEDQAGDVQCNATVTNPANEGRDYVVTFDLVDIDEMVEQTGGYVSLAAGESAPLEAVTYTPFSDDLTCTLSSVEVYSTS